MERDYGLEIDSLKKELNEIKQLLQAFVNATYSENEEYASGPGHQGYP